MNSFSLLIHCTSYFISFFKIYIYLFYLEANHFTILYWFCDTLTWIRHGCTCVSHPEPHSHLLPHHFLFWFNYLYYLFLPWAQKGTRRPQRFNEGTLHHCCSPEDAATVPEATGGAILLLLSRSCNLKCFCLYRSYNELNQWFIN